MRSLIITALIFASSLSMAEAHKYTVDAVHTAVIFKISHLGFSNTYGRFTGVEGSFTIDEDKPEKSTLEMKIKADSINTDDAKRDKHLKGPDFFNSKQNKFITFNSKSVKKTKDSVYQISGDLTLNGVTRPLTIEFKRSRTGQDPWGKTRTGGDTTFKIKRSDFNMNYMQGENQLGDEVEMIISLEGIRA